MFLMKSRKLRAIVTTAIFLSSVAFAGAAELSHLKRESDNFLAIGTASTSGVYYPVGRAICEQLNKKRLEHGIRCRSYSTGGSNYNVQAITTPGMDLDVALTRADLARGALKSDASSELRAVAYLYYEPALFIIKKDSHFTSIADLKGSRINIGNIGSGKRALADQIFNVLGWSNDDFELVTELGTTKMVEAFCDDEVDVLIQMMGVPSDLYDHLQRDCDAQLIGIDESMQNKLIEQQSGLEKLEFDITDAQNHRNRITTLGGRVILVASKDIKEESIYQLVKSIAANIDHVQNSHPVLKTLTKKQMQIHIKDFPIHPGALTYYREQK